MKKTVLLSAIATVLLIASCKKDNNGNVTFWTAVNSSPNPISVSVGSQNAAVTQYFPTITPGCGTYGCASFCLPAGTYTYTATNTDTTWTGSVSVTKGGCTMQQLSCATGNVTFWVDSAANNIQVTLNGGTTPITAAFPTSTPTCGTSGCANFTLHIGTYNYTAITSGGVGYSGSVRVGNDSCTLVHLY